MSDPASRWLVSWVAAGALALGAVSGATALVGLSAGLVALLMLAYRAAHLPLLRLDAHRELHPTAFEDDTVRVTVLLDNRGTRSAWMVEVVDSFGASMVDAPAVLDPGPLRPRRRRRLSYMAVCSRGYGVFAAGPLAIRVGDPLGLFTGTRAVPHVQPLTVFPRVREMPALGGLGAGRSLEPRSVSWPRPGPGATFLGAREYRPGDEARLVHWRATARRGRLVVREHETDLQPHFAVLVDLHRAGRAGTGRKSVVDYLRRVAASLLWSASRRGDSFRLVAEGREPVRVPAGHGRVHLNLCLLELIRSRQEGRVGLLDLVEADLGRFAAGSTVVMLAGTLRLDLARLEAVLRALRARRTQPLVVVVDGESFVPFDRSALPPPDAAERRNGLRRVLADQGVAGAVLSAADDLEHELARATLFDPS